MAVSHIYQVPFPEAGHAINMLNVGSVLATAELQIHVLVLSRKNTEQWLKATGQPANPHLKIEVLADGKWEDWKYEKPSDLVMILFTPDFNSAVDERITRTRSQFSTDRHTAIMFNPLMRPLLPIIEKHSLKRFILNPTAYYMFRQDGAHKTDGSSKYTDTITYHGIGGLPEPMEAILGDVVECFSSMRNMTLQAMDTAQGMIYSNTNIGLEGSHYPQPAMPNRNAHRTTTEYLIGPILPVDYEHALDSPAAKQEFLSTVDSSHPVIQFLNAHPPNSVVYITLGSVAQFSTQQALQIISLLRRYSQPWVLLHHRDLGPLKSALNPSNPEGPLTDGIISSWTPQLAVLQHPSTKMVLSHGGFGTMIESIYAGQCYITCPVFSDQFIDSRVLGHLGLSLGCIAENRFESILEKGSEVGPYLVGEEEVGRVFEKAFAAGGEEAIKAAKEKSRALRDRMVEAKQGKGMEMLEKLREDLR